MQGVHYVDFHGDLRTAACGWTPPADFKGATVFMSSATCRACRDAIQDRIASLAEPELGDVGRNRLAAAGEISLAT